MLRQHTQVDGGQSTKIKHPPKNSFLSFTHLTSDRKLTFQAYIRIGDVQVAPCFDARNLGVVFDRFMNLDQHITTVCQSSYAHLRRIAAIRASLYS